MAKSDAKGKGPKKPRKGQGRVNRELYPTLEDKVAVCANVCEFIGQGYTEESACEACGIVGRTFRDWKAKFSAIAEMYNKAVQQWSDLRRGELMKKAETSLEKLITGHTIRTQRVIHKAKKDKDGSVTTGEPESIVIEEREVSPAPSAVFFALTNIGPDKWKHRQDVRNTHIGQYGQHTDLSKLTEEELTEYERLVEKAATGSDQG